MMIFFLGISVTLNVILILAMYLFFRYTRFKRERKNNRAKYRDMAVESIDDMIADVEFWGEKV